MRKNRAKTACFPCYRTIKGEPRSPHTPPQPANPSPAANHGRNPFIIVLFSKTMSLVHQNSFLAEYMHKMIRKRFHKIADNCT